ncbi:pentapeptide repeat-containing protein [Cyanobacterium stanieri LEGE 03274]|uniref:Pentapeptide repeat-containing protein n=1 Tax=Cyanobacterium stanieri LEGE 03274 TaxID=1828756 RepID=A0ABR9V4A1_9CHRO|nr:pentapeptide repeat-containing protein [Cyanobacterium stanieri]MBE9222713.1 pentapeptide repeat-containing protein [Cyanobacterium stanieri LEGE 03274]
MKKYLTLLTLTLSILPLSAKAENIAHLNQLLRTKQCQECDLSQVGLVMANLSGANLVGANLIGANLSRANLMGADLSYANLTGASLHGANLAGVNLTGAILNQTDLRNARVNGANFEQTDLSNAQIDGIIGISNNAFSAEQFFAWALAEDRKGDYPEALRYYNTAIELDPDMASAYLARGIIRARYDRMNIALEDFTKAQAIFTKQNNEEGLTLANQFIELSQAKIENPMDPLGSNQGSPGFVQAVSGVLPFVFRFFGF